MRRAALLFAIAALAAGASACSSRPSDGWHLPTTLVVSGDMKLGTASEASVVLTVQVDIPFSGSVSRTVLDGVTIQNPETELGSAAWTLDSVEADPADWPVTVEDYGTQTRFIRVTAHGPPHPFGSPPNVTVALIDGGGRYEVTGSGGLTTTITCEPGAAEPLLEGAGRAAAWSFPTAPGLPTVRSITGDGAGGVWVTGRGFDDRARLFHASAAGVDDWIDLIDDGPAIAAASGASIALTDLDVIAIAEPPPTPGAGPVTLRWEHDLDLADGVANGVAVSEGRLVVGFRPLTGTVTVDGVGYEQSVTGYAIATFDEATGAYLGAIDVPRQIGAMTRGPAGGVFVAFVGGGGAPSLTLLDASFAEVWSVALDSTPLDLETSADGDVWIETAASVRRLSAAGVEKAKYGVPVQGSLAPDGAGGFLLGGTLGLAHVSAEGEVSMAAPAPTSLWCPEEPHALVAPTAGGVAFAFIGPAFDQSLSTLGVLVP